MLPNGDFETAEMNSFNHYAYGSIGEWLYRRVAGIDVIEPGYKKIRIKPMFVMGIKHAEGRLETMYGLVSSSWHCDKGKIPIDITIPANCAAEVSLPEKEGVLSLGSGTYHYEYETKTDLEIPRYTMDSTLGEILEAPGAPELLEKAQPGFMDNPMLGLIKAMTLEQLARQQAGPGKEAFDSLLSALNKPGG